MKDKTLNDIYDLLTNIDFTQNELPIRISTKSVASYLKLNLSLDCKYETDCTFF